jgi:hypothetical protein
MAQPLTTAVCVAGATSARSKDPNGESSTVTVRQPSNALDPAPTLMPYVQITLSPGSIVTTDE